MKFEVYRNDLVWTLFNCEDTNNNKCHIRICNKCTNNTDNKCYIRHLKEQIQKDCSLRNYVKWLYLIKHNYIKLNIESTHITDDYIIERGVKVSILRIKNDLQSQYEEIDTEELDNIITKSLLQKVHVLGSYNKVKCIKCNHYFTPQKVYHILCDDCYWTI